MTAQSRLFADRPLPSRSDFHASFHDLEAPRLYEAALRRGEGVLAKSGALVVETAPHTGRSPDDKFIVRDTLTDGVVWWDQNQAMTPQAFERLYADMAAHALGREIFVQNLQACADPAQRLHIRVYSEYAWHSLSIRNLLIKPELPVTHQEADFTIIVLPSFQADPLRHGCRSSTVIALDFTRRFALIGGTSYAGEIKKAVFTFLNFLMPSQGVLPMHCAANVADGGAAIFFGLSGTGKTSLSADPARTLIGDDEHGWGADGVFNFEGGCYAKTIRLSHETEPDIHAAAQRFGAILENVGLDASRGVDFNDDTKTENTRATYPLDFITNASREGRAGHPENIVMLTCDAFGVLPPIARLDPAQAMYHFLSGYTARVAGTENGAGEPRAVFSTCFGAPFMPRHPTEYGRLLRDRITRHKANCWLVNTGWTGGRYGEGQRMPIATTRALLRAALQGALAGAPMRRDPWFGLETPMSAPGVASSLLDPASTWRSQDAFAATARELVAMFEENFKSFAPFVTSDIRDAAPRHA